MKLIALISGLLLSLNSIAQVGIKDMKYRGAVVYELDNFQGEKTKFVKPGQTIAIDESKSIQVYGAYQLVRSDDQSIAFSQTESEINIDEGIYTLEKTDEVFVAIIYSQPKFKGEAKYLTEGMHTNFPFIPGSIRLDPSVGVLMKWNNTEKCFTGVESSITEEITQISINKKYNQCPLN